MRLDRTPSARALEGERYPTCPTCLLYLGDLDTRIGHALRVVGPVDAGYTPENALADVRIAEKMQTRQRPYDTWPSTLIAVEVDMICARILHLAERRDADVIYLPSGLPVISAGGAV